MSDIGCDLGGATVTPVTGKGCAVCVSPTVLPLTATQLENFSSCL